ncbi:MAG: D-cysteine desulfhydrase family protein [Deltaproteobacteria bacterium]|nr:D-cysteine desulfhydrase family protein [Deltaproteobacteria bacterium]MBW2255224.1 D-cysteine desulfhydrase family protein [Deltaproteobacteria bacterium]
MGASALTHLRRLELARLPTPIQYLERLSSWLGAEVYVKRDDLTGLGLSGNKVRKLELLLAEAVDHGAEVVVTCGGIQSNHCRATAVAARQLGLQPVLLLRGERSGAPDGNLLLDDLLGAEVHTCDDATYRDHREEVMTELARGRPAYVIPEGGSNGLGAMGYVLASEEAAAQVAERFDRVVVAVGSGGTLAGLAMGSDLGPVRGIAVCDDALTFTTRVRAIASEAERLGARALPPSGRRWRVVEGYQGPAYAVAEPPVWEVIRKVAHLEGLILDPVYTGKAVHALVEEVRAGRWGGRILFWHTGGAFGLFGRGGEATADPASP